MSAQSGAPDSSAPPRRDTWRLVLEYDGAGFNGWQRQPGLRTIQAEVESALERVLGGQRTGIVASGRTDAGVHALGQIVSFRTTAARSPDALRDGLNALMPREIACLEAGRAHPEFHAIRDASGKLYRYVLRLGPARSALRWGRCWHHRYALDLEAMQAALSTLVGRHDFTSFRAAGCSARSPVRTLRSAHLREVEDEIWIELYGQGFLRYMVRNIVGSLIDVGRGQRPPPWFGELLEIRDRRAAGRTAPPQGLFLVRVDYPPERLVPPG